MSSNDAMLVVKRKSKYEVYWNVCVDNEYDYHNDKPFKIFRTKRDAMKFCNGEQPEYGIEYIVEKGVKR